MTRDLPCVYRAASVGEADVVAAWLAEQGIVAFVKDRNLISVYGPLAIGGGATTVCVADSAQAARAESLLSEHDAVIKARRAAQASQPPIEIICKACGTVTTFPAHQRNSVQTCPKCRAYVDVVDAAKATDSS